MAKKKPSRDQKRKRKLAKREERRHKPAVAPYTGSKYQADEFIPLVSEAEIAIREVDALTGRVITDRQVIQSLEHLVLLLRGTSPKLPEGTPRTAPQGEGQHDFIAWNVQRHWSEAPATTSAHFSMEDRIGVLRTLLNSVPIRSRHHGSPRGYLKFIDRFLAGGEAKYKQLSDEDLVWFASDVEAEEDEEE